MVRPGTIYVCGRWLLALPLVLSLALSSRAQTLSPTSLSFGNWEVGTTSHGKIVTLTNTQSVALTISSIVSSGDFTQTANCPLAPKTLGASQSCKIQVTFTPTAVGSRTGTLTVSDNGATSTQTAQLSGTGEPPATLSPASLTFGNQFVGIPSAAKSVVLTNFEPVPLTIFSISASGDFAATSNCPLAPNTLASRGTCTIYVTFTPTTVGMRSGTLTVNDNATNTPQTAALSGTGGAITLTPNSLAFPSQLVTTTSTVQTIKLKNAQPVALAISSITTTGDFAETTGCPLAPQTLAPGATCNISVTFTPTALGARNGILTVTDNAAINTVSATLTGTGSLSGITSVVITPANPQAAPGSQLQLTATGGSQTGGQVINITNFVTWSSTAPAIAQVNATGLVQAVAQGSATISASTGSVVGTVTFTVGPPTVSSITVTPSNPSVPLGAYQQFTAILNYSDGSIKDATTVVSWSSSAATVAAVDNTGLATTLSAGSTTISASLESVSGNTLLTVSQPPCTAPPAGLIGWWTGDGNAVDIAGANSGTLQNGASYTSGEVASAFNFPGNNASLLVNAPVYSPTAGTLMFWFMSTGGGVMTGSVVGGTNRALGLSVDSGGNLDWEFGNLSSQSLGQVSPNHWHFVAMTYQTSGTEVTVNIYLDGNQVATAIANANQTWNPQVIFGSYLGSPVSSFIGSMDEIAIFNQALSSQQIQQVYTAFSAGMCKPTLQSIALNPSSPPLLAPAATLQFTAAGSYSNGSVHDLTSSATWSSSNAAAATISPSGLATGVAPGSTIISAALAGQNGSTTLNVGPSLVSIQITPPTPTIAAGTSVSFTATGIYSDNSQQNITASVIWGSNPLVATISSNGVATGIAAGQTTISATAGSVNASALLTVTSATLVSIAVSPGTPSIPSGTTQQFSATGRFSDSSTQDLSTQVTWSSSNTAVATINTSGLASSIAPGQVTITATFGTVSNFATLTVTSAVLTSIAVTPANQSLVVGGTLQFTATGIYSDNSQQNLTSTATWSSSNQTNATISSSGLATGLMAGSTTISATVNGINGFTTLTVVNVPPTLQTITVSPSNAMIAAGLNQPYTAQGTFSDGSMQNLTSSVQWSSAAPAVATISNTPGSAGLATAVAIGSTSITATLGSVSGSANLSVSAAAMASIEISPQSASIAPESSAQFSATALFTDGSSSNVTSSVQWGSSVSTVAIISNTAGTQGLASAVGSGATRISATLGSVIGSTILSVQDPLVSISVTPTNATLVPGTNQQFTATGGYASGLEANITNNVLWNSSSPAVAIVTSTGLAMSAAAGETVLTASAGSVNGSANLAVTPIQHLVFIVQENRSPDNLFHGLPNADIANSGPNSEGQVIQLQQVPLAVGWDIGHSHDAFEIMYDNGDMDGENLIPVTCSSGCPPPTYPGYSYVNPSDVAPYFQMAEQYTFGDRMFQTNQGPSFPAHQFVLAGTSAPTATSDLFVADNPTPLNLPAGCTAPSNETVRLIDPSGSEFLTQYPCFEHPTMVDSLDNLGISWRYYAPSPGSIWTAPNAIQHLRFGPDWANVIMPSTGVLTDIANGQLSTVSWVIPSGQASDHPNVSDGSGPSWVASVVNAIGNSSYWSNTAIVIVWDDWGGWYDHVPPPIFNSYEYGFRVPLIVVSPYAKPGYVSHITYDFGSLLRLIEETFNVPSLGYADSFANDLSDCFDFSQTPLTFQTIAAPLDANFFLHDKRPPLDPDDD